MKISQKLHTPVTYNHCMWTMLKIMLNFVYAIIFCMTGMCLFDTYYVPTTLVVSSWIWSPLNIRAIPKSEILGFSSVSNKTLLVLRSLWIILNLESWWRYKIPRAISMMISKRFLQFNNELLVWSTTKFFSCTQNTLFYVLQNYSLNLYNKGK